MKEEDFDLWLAAFRNAGYLVRSDKTFLKEQVRQRSLTKDGYYKVDITTQFNWQEKIYFDLRFLWNSYDKENHRMDKEANFLVNFATIIFKRMSLNILDCLYLKELMIKDLNNNLGLNHIF